MKRKHEVLRSIPGLGQVAAAAILTFLLELGTMGRKEIGSIAGLVQHTRQSGQWKGKPKLWGEYQALTGEISFKPTTENQSLSSRLSNHLRARKGALGGWCGGVFRSVKRYDPSALMRRHAPFPGGRA